MFTVESTLNLDEALLAVAIATPEKNMLERAAIEVQATATRLAPVDTGRLQASIDYVVTEDAEGPVALIGTNVPYGIFVELGTVHAAAQPFLRPALEAL